MITLEGEARDRIENTPIAAAVEESSFAKSAVAEDIIVAAAV